MFCIEIYFSSFDNSTYHSEFFGFDSYLFPAFSGGASLKSKQRKIFKNFSKKVSLIGRYKKFTDWLTLKNKIKKFLKLKNKIK